MQPDPSVSIVIRFQPTQHLRPSRPLNAAELPQGPIGFRLCHELEGLLTGIQADRVVHQMEIDRLVGWLAAAERYRSTRPFSELIVHLEHALEDGVLTLEECADLQFLTERCTTVNPHFSALRAGLQVLQGVMTGVSADEQIPEIELRRLQEWIESWSHQHAGAEVRRVPGPNEIKCDKCGAISPRGPAYCQTCGAKY